MFGAMPGGPVAVSIPQLLPAVTSGNASEERTYTTKHGTSAGQPQYAVDQPFVGSLSLSRTTRSWPFAGTNSRPLRAAAWPLHRPALLSLALLCSKGVTSKEQGIFCTSQLAPAWHRSSPAKLGSARGHPSPDDAIRPPRARFPDQCRDSNVMTTSVASGS